MNPLLSIKSSSSGPVSQRGISFESLRPISNHRTPSSNITLPAFSLHAQPWFRFYRQSLVYTYVQHPVKCTVSKIVHFILFYHVNILKYNEIANFYYTISRKISPSRKHSWSIWKPIAESLLPAGGSSDP